MSEGHAISFRLSEAVAVSGSSHSTPGENALTIPSTQRSLCIEREERLAGMVLQDRRLWPLAAALSVLAAGPAQAESACPDKTVCAADPDGIAALMQEEGYRAKVGKARDGDPMIESGAGYDYTIQFYQCTEGKDCKSLQFLVLFKDDGTNTPELANRWNKTKRFVQMAARDDGTLSLSYDVTTVGGLTRANFADVLDWWAVMLAQASSFFSELEKPGGGTESS